MNSIKMDINASQGELPHLVSASGLDILRTKLLEKQVKEVGFFEEDSAGTNPNANRRMNPLLSESITRMIGVPHLHELFDEMASGLATNNQQNLNALGIETYVEPNDKAAPRFK